MADGAFDLDELDQLHTDLVAALAGGGYAAYLDAAQVWVNATRVDWPAVAAEVRRLRAENAAALAVLRDLAASYEGPYDHAALKKRAVAVLGEVAGTTDGGS